MMKIRFALLMFGFNLLFYGCRHQDPETRLPEFRIALVDGGFLNTRDIPAGNPIIIIYYDGECGVCHDEARDITARIDELKDVRFYFVTLEPMEEVKRFKEHLGLGNYENITVGKDVAGFLPQYLSTSSTPVLALFDKRRNLRGIFGDKPPIDTLIFQIRNL